jgi:hypothetical protein
MEVPQRQVWFTKAQTSVNGPYDDIEIAKDTVTNDYEVELVAVIGKGGKRIWAADDAPAAIFGYCVGNDVTERMWQHASPQWSLGKSFDTHAPMGPWIVTADEVGDPHDLGLRCFVNGEKRQDSNTQAPRLQHLAAGGASLGRDDARTRRLRCSPAPPAASAWQWTRASFCSQAISCAARLTGSAISKAGWSPKAETLRW